MAQFAVTVMWPFEHALRKHQAGEKPAVQPLAARDVELPVARLCPGNRRQRQSQAIGQFLSPQKRPSRFPIRSPRQSRDRLIWRPLKDARVLKTAWFTNVR